MLLFGVEFLERTPNVNSHSCLHGAELKVIVAGPDCDPACAAVVPATAVTTGITDLCASPMVGCKVPFLVICTLGHNDLLFCIAQLTNSSLQSKVGDCDRCSHGVPYMPNSRISVTNQLILSLTILGWKSDDTFLIEVPHTSTPKVGNGSCTGVLDMNFMDTAIKTVMTARFMCIYG